MISKNGKMQLLNSIKQKSQKWKYANSKTRHF